MLRGVKAFFRKGEFLCAFKPKYRGANRAIELAGFIVLCSAEFSKLSWLYENYSGL